MKKAILLIALVMTSAMACTINAQEAQSEQNDKIFVTLNAGTAVTLGSFGSTSMNDDYAGFAMNGFNIHTKFGYALSKPKNFNIGFRIDYTKNSFDLDAIWDQMEFDPYFNYTGITSGSWSIFSGMTSVGYSIHAGAGFVDLSASAGLMSVTNPSFLIKIDDGAGTSGLTGWTSTSTLSTCADFGFSVRYPFAKSMCISVGIDYFMANPEINVSEKWIDDSSGSWVTRTTPYKFYQPIGIMNFTGGIGFRF